MGINFCGFQVLRTYMAAWYLKYNIYSTWFLDIIISTCCTTSFTYVGDVMYILCMDNCRKLVATSVAMATNSFLHSGAVFQTKVTSI